MRAITKPLALQLMKKYFWDDVQGDLLVNQSVAEIIADHAINGGEGKIAPIVQRILNQYFGLRLLVDGDIGPKTAVAINAVNQSQLFALIKKGREAEYRRIGGVFMNGWLDRLTKFVYVEKKKLSPGLP
jgi:lysozyme family protein